MITPLTSEGGWLPRLADLPQWQPPLVPTLVVSPHPDDETLGAGGLIGWLRAHGVEVSVAAVTDGESAYGITPGLGERREREQTAALAELGVEADRIHRLRLPDSALAPCEGRLVKRLLELVSPETHIVAPWAGDFHPDHEVCGRAASRVVKLKQLPLTSYLFWTWHRGTPALLDDLCPVLFPLSECERGAKRRALECHRSQLEHASGAPILPENLRAPAYRPFEVYLPWGDSLPA